MATFSSGVKCLRSFLIRSLRYLNGRTLSPFPTEAEQGERDSVRVIIEARPRISCCRRSAVLGQIVCRLWSAMALDLMICSLAYAIALQSLQTICPRTALRRQHE